MSNSASGGLPNLGEDCEIVATGELLTIRRREKGKRERGKWVSSHRYEEFQAQCSFQPLTARETMQLKEGDRKKSHVKVYTDFTMKRDDIIERGGEDYEVQGVDNWGTYTKSIARLVDVERD